MKLIINKKISLYILKFAWSKNLLSLIGTEVEINEEDILIYNKQEKNTMLQCIQLMVDYKEYYIPIDCLSYQSEEINKIYKEKCN